MKAATITQVLNYVQDRLLCNRIISEYVHILSDNVLDYQNKLIKDVNLSIDHKMDINRVRSFRGPILVGHRICAI